jgi:DEAD/DEAH box helicase
MHPLRCGSSSVVPKGNSPTLPGMHLGGPLPIDAALPELTAALGAHNTIVLVAPPGAGKTTRVPLVLAAQAWALEKKIIVLEPRRIAARAAAARMAETLRENVGATVGYRVRFGSRVSSETRIEVVTEGIFTRRVLEQPGLDDVAAVLFDEFHERSLEGDLGLALARDVQQGLREDLKLLVMSATLNGARVAGALGGAPVIEAQDAAFRSRPATSAGIRGSGSSGRLRKPSSARFDRSRARYWCFCPAPPRFSGRRRCCGSVSARRTSTSWRCTARWRPMFRTEQSHRRPLAGARSCWQQR